MKRYIIIFLILIVIAEPSFSKIGKAGWTIFTKIRSPKFRAVTVTPVITIKGDLSGIFYNPAILAKNYYREIFLLSEIGIINDVFGGVIYGHPLKHSSIAGGVVYYNAGKIDLTWLDLGSGELKKETVTAQQDILGIISYGYRLMENLGLGATLKFATSNLFERASATAFAIDFGWLYSPSIIENLTLSGALQNIGTASKFVEKSDPLPLTVFLSAGFLLEFGKRGYYYIKPAVDTSYLIVEEQVIPEIGVEFGKVPFSLNVGYTFIEEANWHFGVAIYKKRFDIAYGYLPGIFLNPTHRLSIGYRF